MKKKLDANNDLLHMDAPGILQLSRGVAGMTNAEVSRRMGLGEETIARYQRQPGQGEHAYDLGIGKIAAWCEAVGNRYLAKWIAQQCGGVFVFVDKDCPEDMSISGQIKKLNDSTAAVVGHILRSLEDGSMDDAEQAKNVRLLREMLANVESALMVSEKGARA